MEVCRIFVLIMPNVDTAQSRKTVLNTELITMAVNYKFEWELNVSHIYSLGLNMVIRRSPR